MEKDVQDLRHLDWNEILKHLQNFATSGAAKIALSELQPFTEATQAQQSVENIFQAIEVLNAGSRPFMESLDLFESWHSRLRKNAVLKPLEIKDVRHFCLEVLAFSEIVQPDFNDWSRSVKSRLMDASEPLSAIDQILTPRGEIRSDASETLYRLFREKEDLARQIQNSLDKLVHAHEMSSYLQDKYVTTREGRWVLPVKSGHQHYVPGVIHSSSQTKQTVFMEPEVIIPTNNRLRQVEVEIEEEIERLLIQLSNYLTSKSDAFTSSRQVLMESDILFSKAQWSSLIGASHFEFSENEIFLNDVKHPLLQLGGKKPVANTVNLTPDKCILILSGPNAGGKTVLLKSIGLAAHMARCGLPLCAGDNSKIPLFKNILLGIGDSQDVGEDLSTFAAHLLVLQKATTLKGLEQLILVDEICGATDPEEGSALARSFIENFAANHCFSVITSHLGPLKSGWDNEGRVLNGSLEYDAKSGRPTYHFLSGIPGDSLAIQTAKRIGVGNKILDRAIELLSPTTQKRLAGIEELDRIKSDLQVLRDSLKVETQKAKAEKDKYQKLFEQIEKEKDKLLSKAVKDSEKKIDEMISQAKVEQTFQKHRNLQEIKSSLPEIVKSRPGQGSSQQAIETSEDFAKAYPPGSKIYIPSLGQDGLVQSTPNQRGEVLVLSNSLRLTLPWKELKPATQPANPTAQMVRRNSSVSISLGADSDKVVDLRGRTVEEALSELEIQLDQSASRQEDRIKIIHGHGTEALKKAVRAYLSRSSFVKKWKAGSIEQGGDGVTWAELGHD